MKLATIMEARTWLGGLASVIVLTLWAGLRGTDGVDTQVYLHFYESLIVDEVSGANSCQSFEPLFCVISLFVSRIVNSSLAVHYFWVFLYYIFSFRAFLLIYDLLDEATRCASLIVVFFIFCSINYVDPQIVFFLTRQYVSSSLLMLGFAQICVKKSPIFSFASATLVHFGALPLALIALGASRGLGSISKNLLAAFFLSLILVIFCFGDFYIFEIYRESIAYKIVEYASKNDGEVTAQQELRLLIYWAAFVFFLWRTQVPLWRAGILIYIFYGLTFFNDLVHLRYYKYLDSMSWPGALMLFLFFRERIFLIVSLVLLARLYKYIYLFAPESFILSQLIFLLKTLLN